MNHQKACLLSFTLIVLQYWPALGRDHIYYAQNTESMTEVKVLNGSNEAQPVWILLYEDEFIEEHYFELPAYSVKTLKVDSIKKPNWNFTVLSKTSKVAPTGGWNASPTSRYEMKVNNLNTLDLNILNLYLEKQKIWITYFDSNNTVLSTTEHITNTFRKSINLTEKIPVNTIRIEVEGEALFLLPNTFKPLIDTKRKTNSTFKYFLVQNGTDGSSFVAPIDDLKLIQQARDEITNFQGFIVFADIELNTTQANRDFSNQEKNFWSWSIKKVTRLNQIGADWCQAYPEMIERMLHGFLRQGSVCFRGQKIIRELKPSEVESGILN